MWDRTEMGKKDRGYLEEVVLLKEDPFCLLLFPFKRTRKNSLG